MTVHNRYHRDQPLPNRYQVAPRTTATTATTPYGGERVAGSGQGPPRRADRYQPERTGVIALSVDPSKPQMRRSYPRGTRGGHLVYRLFDAEGALLYVGVTYGLASRLTDHRRHRPWFHRVRTVLVDTFADRASAEAHERHLIATLRPPHNVVGNR